MLFSSLRSQDAQESYRSYTFAAPCISMPCSTKSGFQGTRNQKQGTSHLGCRTQKYFLAKKLLSLMSAKSPHYPSTFGCWLKEHVHAQSLKKSPNRVCLCRHVCVSCVLYIHMYIMYVCMYVCMYTYLYIHTAYHVYTRDTRQHADMALHEA